LDGKGAYGITNNNSIGIEMCINSDGNYNAMLNNTIILIRSLMKELGLPIANVVRHYDASRKSCPNTMSANNWVRWNQFKDSIVRGSAVPATESEAITLQKRLNVLNYNLVVDGLIGAKTTSAVRDFQAFFNLTVDGIAGLQTNSKLIDVVSRKNNKTPPF